MTLEPDGRASRPHRWLLIAAVVTVAVVTTGLALLPAVRYAYEAPGLQIALNTADAIIALVVGYLVYGRYRQSSRVRDLLLASSLVVLAVANLPFAALPQAVAIQQGSEFGAWAPLFVRTFGAVLMAAAALTPRRLRVDRRTARRAVAGVVGVVIWLGGLGVLAAERLPPAVPRGVLPDASSPVLTGHPAVIVLQVVGMVLYAASAAAFSRAGGRERDEFLHWLAAAAVLAAGARLNYLLFPSLYTQYLYTGDLLRFGFYLLLLVGAAREIRSYWTGRVGAAVARGRRDVLRELEDTTAAELRDAVGRTAELESATGSRLARDAAESARTALARLELALAEVRREIALHGVDEPFEAQLRDAVQAVAARRGLAADVRVASAVDVPRHPEVLLSIASEAVRAAGRGGRASRVEVTVTAEPLRLVVHDDGSALAVADEERTTDLRRIHRLAAEDGGAVTVTTAPGRGTTVTVDWL